MKDERDLERVFRRDLGRVGLPPADRWVPGPRRSWLRAAAVVPLVAAFLIGAVGLGLALEQRRQAATPSAAPTASEGAAGPAASASDARPRVGPVPSLSDLGYTIVAPGPWRRSELLSARMSGARSCPQPGCPVGHDLWTRRTPEFERANASETLGPPWYWALQVRVQKDPQGLTPRQWFEAGHEVHGSGERLDDVTFDGRPAVRITYGTDTSVSYLVARADEMISISYQLQGPPPDHTAADIKAELDAMIASIRLSPGAAVPRVSPAPSPSTAGAFPGVRIDPLVDAKGDFVFAARTVDDAQGWGTTELWAIPLAAGQQARVVLRYPRNWVAEAWPARSLSPDGRRYAFQMPSADAFGFHRIVIADLFSGTLSWIRTADSGLHDGQPVWDPTGRRIAFTRVRADPSGGSQRQDGVWVIGADGTDLRQLVTPTGPPAHIYGWTPDGRYVAFAQNVGYEFVDATSGARVSMDKVVSGDASWRTASPRLVAHGWETATGGDLQYIFTADAPGGARTVVVRATSTTEFLSAPRWRPGRDELLYLRSSGADGQLRVRSLSGGERTLPAKEVGSPAWSPDGSAIVYIRNETVTLPSPSPCASPRQPGICGEGPTAALVTAEIRVIGADGSGDRTLYRLPDEPGKPVGGWCVCVDGLTTRHY